MLSKRVKRIGTSATLRISAAAKALRAEGVDVVDLSIGEPDFPTPTFIKDAAKKALDDNLTGYTANPGTPELRRAICNKLSRDNNLSYELDEVLVSPGAKFSLYLACNALLERGDDAIIPAPYWVSYPDMVRLAGANPVFVPCREEDGFRLTPERLRSVLSFSTKVLFLNYPSNPTGATYTREQLAELAEVCQQEGIWIVADEIYEKLTYDGHQHVSVASVSPEAQKRTVLINGLSKAYAMTGWRLGYAAGPRDVIGAMSKVQSHSTSNACSITQAAAVAALEGPEDEVQRMVDAFGRRRDYLVQRLRAISGVTCDEPHGAFYLYPNMARFFEMTYRGSPLRNSYGLAYYLLKIANVAVVPGDAFGTAEHIRLSYATGMDRLELAMERIIEAFEQLERPRATLRAKLDNVLTKVDRMAEVEVTDSEDSAARLTTEANEMISDDDHYAWNASIGGVVVQLVTNSPHLYDYWIENWYPAPQEGELEPDAVIYGVKGLGGRQPSAVYHPQGHVAFVINTGLYGQLRAAALSLAADVAERTAENHLVRAACVEVDGRGLLLMGGPGSGMAEQLWRLARREDARVVATDVVFVHHADGAALIDPVERKFYVKTRWVEKEPRLTELFDRCLLENALVGAHDTELCDGGDACRVTRGEGACYAASDVSRAMLDPYWLGGAKRHAKRARVSAVAIFRREPEGSAVQDLQPAEALSLLEHAQPTGAGAAGGRTVPWLNEYLLDTSAERLDAQRRLFGRLFAVARPLAVNAAYTDPGLLTDQLLEKL